MIKLILGFLLFYIIVNYLLGLLHKNNLKKLEIQFLIGSLYFEQYRYHIIQILQLAYEKAKETDEIFVKDYDAIVKKINESIDLQGDLWIANLNKTLGYKLNFNSWKELINQADQFIKANKKWTQKER